MTEASSQPVAAPTEDERKRAGEAGMLLALWARLIPDAPAVLSDEGTRSFRQLNENANRLARALRASGLCSGDALVIACSNRPEFAETVYACMRSGFRYTPLNWHLSPDEAAYIVADCGAKALIADARFADTMQKVAERTPALAVRLAVGGEIAGFRAYEDALAEQDPSDLEDPELGTRMLYTSGTTGKPKGVARPKSYVVARSPTLVAAGYAPGAAQLHLCTGPLYHAAPIAFSLTLPLSEGVGVVLMERFDAEETLRLIERHGVTHTHMVPTMFHRLLRLPSAVRQRYDLRSLRYVVHGAAPCPVATKRALIDWLGPIVWEYYAATEGSGTNVSPDEWLKRPGTVGKPPTPDHVLILDEQGEPCPPEQPGTVYLKVIRGAEFEYHGDPEKTRRAHRGQHFTLGDVGYLDRDGYLFLTDRSAHLIISGGVNIYPAEVEAVLLQHPAVHDVGVIGIPNEEWGEEVKAVVEPSPGVVPSDELGAELIEFCRERLAHFKCPRTLEFIARLPRHDNGKLYKHKLREVYRALSQPPPPPKKS